MGRHSGPPKEAKNYEVEQPADQQPDTPADADGKVGADGAPDGEK
ncbi:hypothetical protein HNP84_004454 [Thermocatellispora tengchongensis]|uniref:Uncharacterized protein n=1 Tax=Thermocatellispora tengchongensis TaxID=1073253 RepID=A0A840PBD2_9ACTN|nr:hypothetical protein [Thermocatellispora tengchongensis]MBB5134720.1 hypothetical protein [Thermocatellispora tengchongensis]